MEIDFKVEVDHRWIYERPYKVTLTRGARGDYRWEIEVRDTDWTRVVEKAIAIDNDLKTQRGGLEPPEEE